MIDGRIVQSIADIAESASSNYKVMLERSRMFIQYVNKKGILLFEYPTHAEDMEYICHMRNPNNQQYRRVRVSDMRVYFTDYHGSGQKTALRLESPSLDLESIAVRFIDRYGQNIDLATYGSMNRIANDYYLFERLITQAAFTPGLEGFEQYRNPNDYLKIQPISMVLNNVHIANHVANTFKIDSHQIGLTVNPRREVTEKKHNRFLKANKYSLEGKNLVNFTWSCPDRLGQGDFELFVRYNIYAKRDGVVNWRPLERGKRPLTRSSFPACMRQADVQLYSDPASKKIKNRLDLYGYYGKYLFQGRQVIAENDWLGAATLAKVIDGKLVYLYSEQELENKQQVVVFGPFPEELPGAESVEFEFKKKEQVLYTKLDASVIATDPAARNDNISIPPIQTAGKFLFINDSAFKVTDIFDFKLKINTTLGGIIALPNVPGMSTDANGFICGTFKTGLSKDEEIATHVPQSQQFKQPVTRQKTDVHGNIVESTDAAGHTTIQEYSTHGELERVIAPTIYIPKPQDRSKTKPASPVTELILDIEGVEQGYIDAKQAVWQQRRQQGRVGAEIDPTGVQKVSLENIFGEPVAHVSASGHTTKIVRDKLGSALMVVSPEIDDHRAVKRYLTNSLRQRIRTRTDGGQLNWFAYDYDDNQVTLIECLFKDIESYRVTQRFFAIDSSNTNTVSVTAYDHGHKYERELIRTLDPFGHELELKDYSGNTYETTYNGLFSVVSKQQTDASDDFRNAGPDGKLETVQIKPQHLEYTFAENGTIAEVKDVANGTRALKFHNELGLLCQDIYIHSDGSYQRFLRISYDAMQRETILQDLRMRMKYVFDIVGNRSSTHVEIRENMARNFSHLDKNYYDYDAANRILTSCGKLCDDKKAICLKPGSYRFEYVNGLIRKEHSKDFEGIEHSREIFYDAKDRIITINEDNLPRVQYRWSHDDQLEEYKDWDKDVSQRALSASAMGAQAQQALVLSQSKPQHYTAHTYEARTGLQLQEVRCDAKPDSASSRDKSELKVTSTNTGYSPLFASATEVDTELRTIIRGAKDQVVTQTTRNEYMLTHAEQLRKVTAYQKGQEDRVSGQTFLVRDSNQTLIKKIDNINPGNSVLFINDLSFNVVVKVFHDATDGNRIKYIGRYFYKQADLYGQYFTAEDGKIITADNSKNHKLYPNADMNYFPANDSTITTAGSYTVVSGDTWESISLRLYGNPFFAHALAVANGGDVQEPPVVNEQINTLIRSLSIHNNAKTRWVINYGEIYGSFHPTMPEFIRPKPKYNSFVAALAYAVEAAALILAPETGGTSLGLLKVAAILAAANAYAQGLNMMAGNQRGFSVNQMAIAAGAAALSLRAEGGLKTAVAKKAISPIKALGIKGLSSTIISINAQLASGQKPKFQDVFMSFAGTLAAGAMSEFKLGSSPGGIIFQKLAHRVVNLGLTVAIRGPESLNMAYQVGDLMGSFMAENYVARRKTRGPKASLPAPFAKSAAPSSMPLPPTPLITASGAAELDVLESSGYSVDARMEKTGPLPEYLYNTYSQAQMYLDADLATEPVSPILLTAFESHQGTAISTIEQVMNAGLHVAKFTGGVLQASGDSIVATGDAFFRQPLKTTMLIAESLGSTLNDTIGISGISSALHAVTGGRVGNLAASHRNAQRFAAFGLMLQQDSAELSAAIKAGDSMNAGRVSSKYIEFLMTLGIGSVKGISAVAARNTVQYASTSSISAGARDIAAHNIREARYLLSEAGLPRSQRHEIIRSFDLESFRVTKTANSRVAYRTFDDFNAVLEGRYVSGSIITNQTDRIKRLALVKNSATRLGEVTIPKDSIIFEGVIAPQMKFDTALVGGERQMFLTGNLDGYTYREIMMPRNTASMGRFMR